MMVSTGRLTAGQSNFLDVSGNGSIEPRDAFLVVRELNRQLSNRRDAEAESESATDQMAVKVDWIFSDRDSESE